MYSASDALDDMALTFGLNAGADLAQSLPAPFPVAPEGAEGGDAVLMDATMGASGAVTAGMTGRGMLTFCYLGALTITLDVADSRFVQSSEGGSSAVVLPQVVRPSEPAK